MTEKIYRQKLNSAKAKLKHNQKSLWKPQVEADAQQEDAERARALSSEVRMNQAAERTRFGKLIDRMASLEGEDESPLKVARKQLKATLSSRQLEKEQL